MRWGLQSRQRRYLGPQEEFYGIDPGPVEVVDRLPDEDPGPGLLRVGHGSPVKTNDIVNLKSLPNNFLNTIITCNQLFDK